MSNRERKILVGSAIFATASFLIVASYLLNEDAWRPQYSCGMDCQGSYLIKVPHCLIPDVDLNHPSLIGYRQRITRPMHLVCSNIPPLTESRGLSLLLFKERLSSYGSPIGYRCYYQGIVRVEQSPLQYDIDCDNRYELKNKIPLNSTETRIDEDAIIVTCEDSFTDRMIYKDVHYFVQPRRVQIKRDRFKLERKTTGKRRKKLNVIIMATDSVSRANMRRHMPKTFNFLKNELKAIDFKGFHKVADNTCPNVMAILTGLTYKDLEEMQKPKNWWDVKLDDYPFVWKEFSNAGYVTVFTEDSPNIGTFTYTKTGFVEEPTDYYTRPFFQASEDIIGHAGNGKMSKTHQCQGTKWTIKLIHNLSLEIADTFRDVPHFGLYWTSSITHDYMDLAALADQPSVEYLKALQSGGHLEDSVLFFISDHGIRFGDYRKTYTGLLEERMPYVMLILPEWFKREHSKAYKNLLANQERLTSTFDLHTTLRDILHQSYSNLQDGVPPERYGRSLFQEVPLERTCRDAGIPEKYCACQQTKEINSNDPHLVEAAQEAIDRLNEGLEKLPECAQLTLDKVLSGRVGLPRQGTKPSWKGTVFNSYIVTFTTLPGSAMMEGHLQYHNGEYHLMSDVSRINRYGNQSHCIHNLSYQMYCFCKDLL